MNFNVHETYQQLQARMPSLPTDVMFLSCGGYHYESEVDVPPMLETLFRTLQLKITWTVLRNPEVLIGHVSWKYQHRDGGTNGKLIADFWLSPDGKLEYREDAR